MTETGDFRRSPASQVPRGLSAAKKNASAGYVNFLVLALIGLFINPFLLSYLGSRSFGTWRACQRFLDFASVADGRATQALKWVVAYKTTDENSDTKRRDVGAAVLVWFVWLPVLVTLAAAITLLLPLLIRGTHGADSATVRWVGLILCANIVLAGLLNLPDSVLTGTNQGYRSMTITTVVVVTSNAAMVVAARIGGSIISLAAIVLSAAVLNGFLTWLVARRNVSWWGIGRPRAAQSIELARFSGWVLLWEFVQKLLLSSEIILFSTLVGAVAVTNFVFTSYIVSFGLSISLITTSALMPKLGAAVGGGSNARAESAVREAKQTTLAVATIIGGLTLLFNGDFIDLWVGSNRYLGNSVNALMVIAFVQLAILRSDAQIQDTGLSIRFKVLVGATGSVTGILTAWGAYYATDSRIWLYVGLIVGRMIVSVVFPLLVRRMVPGTPLELGRHGLALAVLAGCYALGVEFRVRTWGGLFGFGTTGFVVLALVVLYGLLSSETRAKVLRSKRQMTGARHRG